jgi:hypothetical protein
MTRQEEFDLHWKRLNDEGPNPGLFKAEHRSLAALFFDLGVSTALERVRDSMKPFVASRKPTE